MTKKHTFLTFHRQNNELMVKIIITCSPTQNCKGTETSCGDTRPQTSSENTGNKATAGD